MTMSGIVDKAYQRAKEAYFYERTQNHIDLVRNAALKIAQVYPEFISLIDITNQHDASKYQDPERGPYIDLTWNKFIGNDSVDPLINEATLHHITNNSHHPEFWNKDVANISATNRDASNVPIDASKMPDLAIAEMVADWRAMSEELGTNTARQWFGQTRNVRWKFTPHQETLIDKLLSVFE